MVPAAPVTDARFTAVLRRRRMVRAPYADRDVPVELVEQLIADAQRAPSAGFAQGVGFVGLRGEDVVEFWRTTLPPNAGVEVEQLLPCPIVLLPFGRRQVYLDRYSEPDKAQWRLDSADAWPAPYWIVDASFASMTLLLSATARGLGAAFFGLVAGEDELRRRHRLPDDAVLIGAISLGYPRADDRPAGSATSRSRRGLDEVLRWQRFD